jgi:thiamine biosynthesis protein ThiI
MLLVRYSEIALKGENRGIFEAKLIENIRGKLPKVKIERDTCSILIHSDDFSRLNEIFGISWFAKVEDAETDLEKIKSKVLEILKQKKPKTFRITANRSDKTFPMKSQDLAREIGKICEEKGFSVELKNAELEIFIDVLKKRTIIYAEKHEGLGGLPLGSSGKVLCLLSGGIDSPVAAFLIAKRGCTVDFLHFFALRSKEDVEQTKIPKLVAYLEKFCGKSKLILAPTIDFQLAVMEKGEYELQLFRKFILKVAEKIVKENNYSAIVLGDNLNQVASQTLENMTVIQSGISAPIFRPLLTFDKQEIIDLAKKIGTYDLSVEQYKDCCSIIARKPKTKVKVEKLSELEKDIDLNCLVEKTIDQIDLAR